MGWATFWAIFYANSSGHPDFEPVFGFRLKMSPLWSANLVLFKSGKVKNVIQPWFGGKSRQKGDFAQSF
jgi:hypothetical protein